MRRHTANHRSPDKKENYNHPAAGQKTRSGLPAVPVVRYSVPRSSADVASTLAGLTGRTRGGTWGAMVFLSRAATLSSRLEPRARR